MKWYKSDNKTIGKIILSLAFTISACNSETDKTINQVQVNSNASCFLISCSHKLIMDAVSDEGMLYQKDRNRFIAPYTSMNYLGDTLIVKTVQEINNCSEEVGIITIKNDTIHLKTKPTKDEFCNSSELHLLTYKIKTDKKYAVKF